MFRRNGSDDSGDEDGEFDDEPLGSIARGPHYDVPVMTEEELEAVMANFANEDASYDKTWTRVVVEKFLGKFSWYAPRKDMKNAPSLSKAYAYYEHVTLPRHFVGEQTADHIQRRAEPGESNQATELYSPFTTPSTSFIEWGIGIDLYFSSLKYMAGVLFVCGLVHLPNIVFYRGTDYSPAGKEGLPWSLQGSAVCTTNEWVVCNSCPKDEWRTQEDEGRWASATSVNGTIVTLVKHNLCNGGKMPQGLVNLMVLFFLVIVVWVMSLYLEAREVRFDEDKVTATDYSIVVKNPPKDAYNPDEWRDFFSQFAEKQVTAVTVALSNDDMLRKLIARRTHRNNLRLMLPKGIDMNDEDAVRIAVANFVMERDSEPRGFVWKIFDCTLLPILRIFNMLLPAETLVDRVFTLTSQIEELQTEKYDVARVFVTFETEEGQRAALSALSIGRLDIMMDNKASIAPSAVFKDTILHIDEPAEPSAVRWLNLSASAVHKTLMKSLNIGITVLLVAIAGYWIDSIRSSLGAWAAGPLISIFNTLIPLLVKLLMLFEPHESEGSFQAALYMKITLFRWVNTALLTKVITPWTSTLTSGPKDVLPAINAILWSELIVAPVLRLLDLWGNVQKHILAPRARNQEQMNLSFQGTRYNLGERYTDLTKVLFVCFFYSALYPTSFFFGCAILIVQYYADKFCLMRIWATSASLGSEVAQFSRKYFFTGAVLAYAIISAYAFAGFPYDNVCMQDNATDGNAGTYSNAVFGNGIMSEEPLTVSKGEEFIFCGQDWRSFQGWSFPPTHRTQPTGANWMSDSQEDLTDVYGWTAVAFVIGFVSIFFGGSILRYLKSWWRGVYTPTGQKQHIDFSSNSEIFGYVPQIKIPGFPFPFLACDIDQIDQALIGWNDPTHSYDHHNLIFDIPWKGMPRKKVIESNTRDTSVINQQSEYIASSQRHNRIDLVKPIFSIIKHYPPDWKKKVKDTQ